MTGVVLCGGKSTRMGSDKGLLLQDGVAWARLAAEKLAALGIPVVLSVNGEQAPAYRHELRQLPLVTDQPGLPVEGPLAGLLSVHLAYPDEDLLLLACDLLFMETRLLRQLLTNAWQLATAGAVVFMHNGEREPLCALYAAGGLKEINIRYGLEAPVRHSMKFMLEQLQVIEITTAGGDAVCFRNLNRPGDLTADDPA